jgi:hypothetical protein
VIVLSDQAIINNSMDDLFCQQTYAHILSSLQEKKYPDSI